MCIIIHKEPGIEMPVKRQLKHCWKKNPDGGGFWIVRDNEVDAEKGFMSFKHFWRTIRKRNITVDDEVVIHFRIGTSGKNDSETTHPFPVTDDINMLRNTSYRTKYAMAHNGVIGPGDVKNNLSDTQKFVREILVNLYKYIDDKNVRDVVDNYIDGDRVILFNNGITYRIGSWREEDGLWYSNYGYYNYKNNNDPYRDYLYNDDYMYPYDRNVINKPYKPICPKCNAQDLRFLSWSNRDGTDYMCDSCNSIINSELYTIEYKPDGYTVNNEYMCTYCGSTNTQIEDKFKTYDGKEDNLLIYCENCFRISQVKQV